MKTITLGLLLVFFSGCQSQESKQPATNHGETSPPQPDSMPIIIPEPPESANIVRPETNSDMPVIPPDSISP